MSCPRQLSDPSSQVGFFFPCDEIRFNCCTCSNKSNSGLTYQIGNMISSPSAQIVNAIAENTFIVNATKKVVPAYGPTMGIATAIIAVGIAVTTAMGPERRGRHFEEALPAGVVLESPKDIEQGGAGSTHEDSEKAGGADIVEFAQTSNKEVGDGVEKK